MVLLQRDWDWGFNYFPTLLPPRTKDTSQEYKFQQPFQFFQFDSTSKTLSLKESSAYYIDIYFPIFYFCNMGLCGRGIHKKKNTSFKRGHSLWPQKQKTVNCQFQTGSTTTYKRPTYEQLELAVSRDEQGYFIESPMAAPTRSVMLLRPKVHKKTILDELQHQGDLEDRTL